VDASCTTETRPRVMDMKERQRNQQEISLNGTESSIKAPRREKRTCSRVLSPTFRTSTSESATGLNALPAPLRLHQLEDKRSLLFLPA